MVKTRAFANFKTDWMLVAAFSLAIPVIAMTSALHGQLPGTHDAYLHLVRLINATLNLEAGNLIPRWGPQLHFGFGYPLGDFYAPGWHIAGAFLVATGLPAVWVWLLFQSLGIILYPVGGYLFARLFTNRAGALLGAAVCLFAPLRFYEIFVQGNISQLIAMGLIVWVLWAFARCAQAPSYRQLTLAGLIFAALIITHHPTAALMIPFTGLYAVFAALVAPKIGGRKRQLTSVLAAYSLGLMLSATYWIPAFTEVQYVNVQSAADQFQLQDNFVPLTDLLGPVRAPDRGSLNMPFTLNIGQLALGLAAVGGVTALIPASRVTRWQRAHAIGGSVVVLVGIYAITYPSLWLWETIPKASLILFPWRLLGLVTVMLIPGSAMIMEIIPQTWRNGASAFLVVGLFGSSLPLMFPIYPNITTPDKVTPATSIDYEIASGNLGGVSNNEYLPRWATQRPDFLPCASCYENWQWKVFINPKTLPAGVVVDTVGSNQPRVSAFNVTSENSFRLELHQMYFPGWAATVDGQPIELAITAPYGLLAVDLPSGNHHLEVWYSGTPIQHVADIVSLIGVILLMILFILQSRITATLRTITRTQRSQSFGKTISLGMLISAIALAGIVQPTTDLFRTQGALSAPIGMEQRVDQTFTNKNGEPVMELLGYTLSQQNASYGTWVEVKLYWQAVSELTKAWHTKIALADPVSQAEWVTSEQAAPGGFSTQSWPTDKYVIDENILRIGVNAPPYVGDLVVQVYSAAGEHLTANGSPRLKLTELRIAEKGDPSLPIGVDLTNALFGDWLRLRATQLVKMGQTWQLKLFWEVVRAPDKEYVLMIHMLNKGKEIGTADQSPIPSYLTQHWQSGQYLESTIDLNVPETTDTLLLGLYDRAEAQRLPVSILKGHLQSADQGILLPLEDAGIE